MNTHGRLWHVREASQPIPSLELPSLDDLDPLRWLKTGPQREDHAGARKTICSRSHSGVTRAPGFDTGAVA